MVEYRLASQIGQCETQVNTPAGVIDILSDSEIIEVKEARGWKSAVGQLMVYGLYYPNHTKKLYLFGHSSLDARSVVNECCESLGVAVFWDTEYHLTSSSPPIDNSKPSPPFEQLKIFEAAS